MQKHDDANFQHVKPKYLKYMIIELQLANYEGQRCLLLKNMKMLVFKKGFETHRDFTA